MSGLWGIHCGDIDTYLEKGAGTVVVSSTFLKKAKKDVIDIILVITGGERTEKATKATNLEAQKRAEGYEKNKKEKIKG